MKWPVQGSLPADHTHGDHFCAAGQAAGGLSRSWESEMPHPRAWLWAPDLPVCSADQGRGAAGDPEPSIALRATGASGLGVLPGWQVFARESLC